MYTCIHTCVGVHASFLCGYRALSCGPCRGTAPPMRWGPAWASGRGSDTPFVNLVLSRAGKKKTQNLKEGKMMWFCKGVIFCFVCVRVIFFFLPLSLSPHPPSPWSMADALYVKACNFVLVWGFPLSLFTTRNYTMLWFHRKGEREGERSFCEVD